MLKLFNDILFKSGLRLLILTCFLSCSSNNQKNQEVLDEAHSTQKEVIQLIGELKQSFKTTQFEGRDSLLQIIEEMEEDLFAIPGYSLHLEGHEGHNHEKPDIALGDEEILEVQKELHKQLKQIQDLIINQ